MNTVQLQPVQRRRLTALLIAILAALLIVGCAPQISDQEKEIRIAVALTQTAVALEPATATVDASTETPIPAIDTPAPEATDTVEPTSTAANTATPIATATAVAAAGAATSTPIPASATVTATIAADTAAGGCINDSTFIEDLSVPDGTVLDASQIVTKTWRVKNSGTCIWSSSYTWKFEDGLSLYSVTSVPVAGPVDADKNYDFSVELIAPAEAGRYQGQWRLHDAANVPFGQAVFYDVTVGDTTTTDVPSIAYFNSTETIVPPKGQIILSWDVANAFGGVFLRYGGGEEGVTAPGVKTLFPEKTTTYELVARNDSGENTRQVTVEVTTTVAAPTPDPAAQPTIFYFNATRSKVKAGEQVLLSWDAADAFDGVFLRLADVEEGVIAPGVKAIYPQKDVEYELIARNGNGEARQKIAIEVE